MQIQVNYTGVTRDSDIRKMAQLVIKQINRQINKRKPHIWLRHSKFDILQDNLTTSLTKYQGET